MTQSKLPEGLSAITHQRYFASFPKLLEFIEQNVKDLPTFNALASESGTTTGVYATGRIDNSDLYFIMRDWVLAVEYLIEDDDDILLFSKDGEASFTEELEALSLTVTRRAEFLGQEIEESYKFIPRSAVFNPEDSTLEIELTGIVDYIEDVRDLTGEDGLL